MHTKDVMVLGMCVGFSFAAVAVPYFHFISVYVYALIIYGLSLHPNYLCVVFVSMDFVRKMFVLYPHFVWLHVLFRVEILLVFPELLMLKFGIEAVDYIASTALILTVGILPVMQFVQMLLAQKTVRKFRIKERIGF